MFANGPRLIGFREMCLTTGITSATSSTAATSSITMNLVIWKPPYFGRSKINS